MQNQFQDEQLDVFFRRLNAPLRRMPSQERAELHQELRAHLDALVAAHLELGASPEQAVELALRSFGNPGRIGRRLFWQWRRGQWRGVSPEMKAVLTMLGLYVASTAGLLAALVWSYTFPPLRGAMPEAALRLTLLVGVPSLAGLVLGRLLPKQALAGAFYATVALTLMPLSVALACAPFGDDAIGGVALWAGCWLPCACGAAHLASRRRGHTGRPRLTDLRLRRQ